VIMLLEGSGVMLGVLVWILWCELRSGPAEGADVVPLPL